MTKRILVTGGTGFIGKVIVKHLINNGYKIRVLTRNAALNPFPNYNDLELFEGDLTNLKSSNNALKDVSLVIHCAVNKYDPQLAHNVNVIGTTNLIKAMNQNNVKRIINLSTQSALIKDKSIYGETKALSDSLFLNSGLDFTTLHISTIYGDDKNSVFNKIIENVEKLPIIPIFGSGAAPSNPIYVEDFAEIVLRCINNSQTIKKIYDVGGPEEYTFTQLVKQIARIKNKKCRLIHIPLFMSLAGAKLLETILRNPPINRANVLGLNHNTKCHPQELLRAVGYSPLKLKEGLKKIANNYKKVAIIGLGKMGTYHGALLSTISNHSNYKIVALVDQEKSLAQTAKSMGLTGKFYKDIDQMLKNEEINIAFITTPTFAHKTIAEKLLKKGVHIFVEKPLTSNLKDTEKLVALTQKNNTTVGVGYFYYFRPTFYKFTQLAKELLPLTNKFNIKVEHGDVLSSGRKGWVFNKKSSGGGVLMNPASHAISLLIHLYGLPKQVRAQTKNIYSQYVEDEASVEFIYSPNLKGGLTASWSISDKPLLETTLEITGSFGKVTATEKELIFDINQKITIPGIKKGITKISEDELINDIPENIFFLNKTAGGVGYYLQDLEFIKSALGQKPFINNFEIALGVEKIINTAYQSAKEKRTLKII